MRQLFNISNLRSHLRLQASLAAAVAKAAAEVGDAVDGEDGVVCVTGSMHVVAAALQLKLLYSR